MSRLPVLSECLLPISGHSRIPELSLVCPSLIVLCRVQSKPSSIGRVSWGAILHALAIAPESRNAGSNFARLGRAVTLDHHDPHILMAADFHLPKAHAALISVTNPGA